MRLGLPPALVMSSAVVCVGILPDFATGLAVVCRGIGVPLDPTRGIRVSFFSW